MLVVVSGERKVKGKWCRRDNQSERKGFWLVFSFDDRASIGVCVCFCFCEVVINE